MGLSIEQTQFTPDDYRRYSDRLGQSLRVLDRLLNRPGFGVGPASFGAELELYIIDAQCRPAGLNQTVQRALNDPQCTLELNRFNLEYNFLPVAVSDGPFQATERQALDALQRIRAVAAAHDANVVPIGILPTLRQTDVGYPAMTNIPRYEVLTRELRAIRGGPFQIDIEGRDAVHLEMEDVTLEGANTSFQVHLRLEPKAFADFYNAVQLVTPLVIALGGNSPILFGHQLWQETRIPLFKQSIDCRRPDPRKPVPARVNYGHSWLRKGALELFREAVYLYRPLMPVLGDEEPLEVLKNGGLPQLKELRLQQGSVWLWNRPVYDPSDDGHLRLEMRALPAGPSVRDMIANAVLLIGLAHFMRPGINRLLPAIPFEYCERNFYRAAELGLAAPLIWPSEAQREPEYHTASEILLQLLPKLPQALAEAGFVATDFQPYLELIRHRLETGQTGARWQVERLQRLQTSLPLDEALQQMTQDYVQHSQANRPVSEWSL